MIKRRAAERGGREKVPFRTHTHVRNIYIYTKCRRAILKMDKPNWRRPCSLTANFTYARPRGAAESSISLRLFITIVFNSL